MVMSAAGVHVNVWRAAAAAMLHDRDYSRPGPSDVALSKATYRAGIPPKHEDCIDHLSKRTYNLGYCISLETVVV